MGPELNKIAEIYIRLNPDEQFHLRYVYSFYAWLGSIGGTAFVLRSGVVDVFGGFLYFNMLIELMIPLFTIRKKSNDDKKAKSNRPAYLDNIMGDGEVDLTDFNPGMCQRLYIYFLNTFGCMNYCKRSNPKLKHIVNLIEEGTELLMNNMNLKYMI